jgi:DNA-binding transcriptional regulator YiaG
MSTALLDDDTDTMTKATPLADWVYRLRLHLDLTQEQLAGELNVGTNTVQRWEYATRLPSGTALLLLTRLAREHGFEEPPETRLTRGPRRL